MLCGGRVPPCATWAWAGALGRGPCPGCRRRGGRAPWGVLQPTVQFISHTGPSEGPGRRTVLSQSSCEATADPRRLFRVPPPPSLHPPDTQGPEFSRLGQLLLTPPDWGPWTKGQLGPPPTGPPCPGLSYIPRQQEGTRQSLTPSLPRPSPRGTSFCSWTSLQPPLAGPSTPFGGPQPRDQISAQTPMSFALCLWGSRVLCLR